MATTLILAKGIQEANAYAKLAGLPRFKYRAVRNAGAIRGVRNAEVHVLPSFLRRFDRHQILSALSQAKTLEVFYVDPEDLREADSELAALAELSDEDRAEVQAWAAELEASATRQSVEDSREDLRQVVSGLEQVPEQEGRIEILEELSAEAAATEDENYVGDDDHARAGIPFTGTQEPSPEAVAAEKPKRPSKPRPTKPKPAPATKAADDFFG